MIYDEDADFEDRMLMVNQRRQRPPVAKFAILLLGLILAFVFFNEIFPQIF
jgi:hypothetical protein